MPRKGSSTSANDALNAQRRIKRELMEYQRSDGDKALYYIETVNDDVCDLKGHIYGPPDSPFAGGIFKLEVKIPNAYPFTPPKVKFTTRLWHPNVSSQTGTICLDILKDQWAASLTLRTVMLSLQALLTSPEPDDPQDAVVARQYKQTPALYKETAAYWTYAFATEQQNPAAGKKFEAFDGKIQEVVSRMRCDRSAALAALSWNDWDVGSAVRNLS